MAVKQEGRRVLVVEADALIAALGPQKGEAR
jgi:hypothetical protein